MYHTERKGSVLADDLDAAISPDAGAGGGTRREDSGQSKHREAELG